MTLCGLSGLVRRRSAPAPAWARPGWPPPSSALRDAGVDGRRPASRCSPSPRPTPPPPTPTLLAVHRRVAGGRLPPPPLVRGGHGPAHGRRRLGRPPFTVADLVGELGWPPGVEVGLVETVGGPRSPDRGRRRQRRPGCRPRSRPRPCSWPTPAWAPSTPSACPSRRSSALGRPILVLPQPLPGQGPRPAQPGLAERRTATTSSPPWVTRRTGSRGH